jgi:heterodisulfide reductase subunit D
MQANTESSENSGGLQLANSDRFEPAILGFACNWCGYAAADQAGLTKIQYPANIRILRVMCLGMVDPSLLLRAFANGFDGVILFGCHIGECHYVSGNRNAQTVVESCGNLLHLLGLGRGRLRMEETSAGEAPKFAYLVRQFVEEIRSMGPSPLRRRPGPSLQTPRSLNLGSKGTSLQDRTMSPSHLECIQCNKCTLSCPVHWVDPQFSPRGMILQLQKGGDRSLIGDSRIFRCLACESCREVCPSHAKLVDYMRQLRHKAKAVGLDHECKHGRLLSILQAMMASQGSPLHRLDWTEGLQIDPDSKTCYFVGCSPFFDSLFPHTQSTSAVRSSIQILNRLGIRPSLLADERCCGFDSYWSGDDETFLKLASHNLELLQALSIDKIITNCPECALALEFLYPRLQPGFRPKVFHLSQFLATQVQAGNLRFRELKRKVTYHDPCRLGRVRGEYEAPRLILKAIPGLEVVEMPRNREAAVCCGVGNFANCDFHTKFIQHQRLKEAAMTGAELLTTACPKCRIHFQCYLEGTPVEDGNYPPLEDLAGIVLQAMEA